MNPHFEALKLLKEWSTWLVGIQTAAIAFLGSFAKDGGITSGKGWFVASILCFSLSIIMAANVIGAIPRLVQSLKDFVEHHESIYKMRNAWGIPLSLLATAEHVLFAGGIVALSVFLFWR